MKNHIKIAISINAKVKPFQYFENYLKYGYYPFYKEEPDLYEQRLEEVINMMLEIELPLLRGVDLGYIPKITNVENISSGTEKKWRADVEIIRIKDGLVMGNGSAICSNLEAKKRTFDENAIMSMAQTRAIGKAYRNLIE